MSFPSAETCSGVQMLFLPISRKRPPGASTDRLARMLSPAREFRTMSTGDPICAANSTERES